MSGAAERGAGPALSIPATWDDVTPQWMTNAISMAHPDARVGEVVLLLRDDGTNRRARFGLTYEAGDGPATMFAKAESDAPGRRQIHARNGNLFNEPLLFRSGVDLPIERPLAYPRSSTKPRSTTSSSWRISSLAVRIRAMPRAPSRSMR